MIHKLRLVHESFGDGPNDEEWVGVARRDTFPRPFICGKDGKALAAQGRHSMSKSAFLQSMDSRRFCGFRRTIRTAPCLSLSAGGCSMTTTPVLGTPGFSRTSTRTR